MKQKFGQWSLFIVLVAGSCWYVNQTYNSVTKPALEKGVSRMHTLDFEGAQVSFEKALDQNPSNAEAAYSVGWSLQSQGSDIDALLKYNEALKLATSQNNSVIISQIHMNSGAIHLKMKKYELAEKSFKAAVLAQPKSVDAAYQL